jgi:5-methylcytosine-specific restriction endonuclease McrA
MAKEFSDAFYHSKAWEIARESALRRDSHLCQRCLEGGEITPATMVHHITELTPDNINDPDIATGLDNLVSLCDLCHKKTHGWARSGATRQGFAFDSDGNLICLLD